MVPRNTDDSPLAILPDLLVAAIVVTAAAGGLQQVLALPAIVTPLSLVAYIGVGLGVWRLIGNRAFTPADRVTMGRALLVVLLIGLLPVAGALPDGAVLPFALGMTAFVLDGVDGWVARRLGCENDAGARFDMELDALLLLVLTLWLATLERAGLWVLAIGAWRYAFILAGRWQPALSAPLPPSQRRRVICGIQTGSLVILLAPGFPRAMSEPVAAVLLVLLSYSFITDIVTLLRAERT